MKWIIRNRELLLSSLGFVCIFIFYFFNRIDDKILLGLFGTIATLYFGSIKFKIENDKLFKELFTDFNNRYDNNLNNLLNRIKNEPEHILDNNEKNIIINYLNLCSEEYLWKSRNRIPKNVWKSWKAGIKVNLDIIQVKEVYNNEIDSINGSNSFYGLVEELSK